MTFSVQPALYRFERGCRFRIAVKQPAKSWTRPRQTG